MQQLCKKICIFKALVKDKADQVKTSEGDVDGGSGGGGGFFFVEILIDSARDQQDLVAVAAGL